MEARHAHISVSVSGKDPTPYCPHPSSRRNLGALAKRGAANKMGEYLSDHSSLFVEETRRSHLTAPSQALGLKQNDRRVLVVCLFVELMLPEIQEESGAHQ